MITVAAPTHPGPTSVHPISPSPSSRPHPTSARSRRIALLPPQPDPPSSPPVPARSPLRPTPRSPPDAPVSPVDPALSKRKHALIELLSSERAYASDLALIRDIHIPLALGQPAPFLTSSDSITSPPPVPQVSPMTREDSKIIFGNVEELAVFSEVFCDKLEAALSGVLDPDGDGKDRVGDLFLTMIPHMKPPYTTYITRHPSAVAHLNALPQTPALTAYLAQTHTLAQSYTHAWDLPSLLIKPVQRLLKYPLLLAAIMDDTEPGEAKDKLREARDKVEEVARGVNEGRRRLEVVKNLLDGKHPAPVRLKSIKGLRHRSGGKDDQGQLEMLEKRVHACKNFVHDLAKDIVDWTASLQDVITQLERWSATFGCVIGLGQPHGSEALYLFTDIISSQISPIWISLDAAIKNILLPKLARLLATTAQPLLLLEHTYALRPQHLQLLDTPASKARPVNSLAEASRSYLALEAQLCNELPRYIEILERGFTACLGQFADWQARYWKEVRAQWVDLWDALSIEGDMTAGASDTVKVWWERWESIDAAAANLGITKSRRDRTSRSSQSPGPTAGLATASVVGPAHPTSIASLSPISPPASRFRRHSIQTIDLDINMLLDGDSRGTPGSSPQDVMVASPDSFSSFGERREGNKTLVSPKDDRQIPRRNSSDKSVITRRESERYPNGKRENARQNQLGGSRTNYRLPVVQVKCEKPLGVGRPSTPRLGLRPAATRRDAEKPDILKKKSVDSTPSSSRQSPRASVHTTSSSASSLLNHRLSMQSVDVHIGMDTHASPSPSRASQLAPRTNGIAPAPSASEPVSGTSTVPVVRLTPSTSTEPSSSTSSKNPTLLQNDDLETRGRLLKKLSIHKRVADVFRSPSKRAAPRMSAQALPVPEYSLSLSIPSPELEHPQTARYTCTVVHPFLLPLPPYRDFSFLALHVEDKIEILSEQGHPRDHEELPIRPEDDDIDDCLLLGRDENGIVGWALASCLVILTR